jgi:hypothetical protein
MRLECAPAPPTPRTHSLTVSHFPGLAEIHTVSVTSAARRGGCCSTRNCASQQVFLTREPSTCTCTACALEPCLIVDYADRLRLPRLCTHEFH